jgi:hypothetical protein
MGSLVPCNFVVVTQCDCRWSISSRLTDDVAVILHFSLDLHKHTTMHQTSDALTQALLSSGKRLERTCRYAKWCGRLTRNRFFFFVAFFLSMSKITGRLSVRGSIVMGEGGCLKVAS